MPTAHTAADFPPIKREGPYGVDISPHMEGALFDFIKTGSMGMLVDARARLEREFRLGRMTSLGLRGITLNAPRILPTSSQAAKDRSFGCLNDDLYGAATAAVAPAGHEHGSAEGRTDDEGGDVQSALSEGEHRYLMPMVDAAAFQQLVEGADDNPDPDAINDFWMKLGEKLEFCWTTVRDLGSDSNGRVRFIAQPEGGISVGPVMLEEEDPAEVWLRLYSGRMPENARRFSRSDMLEAFNAGRKMVTGHEVEVDGQMIPTDYACEVLQAKIDDIMNIARDARDTLNAALADDDTFEGFTVDGEEVA